MILLYMKNRERRTMSKDKFSVYIRINIGSRYENQFLYFAKPTESICLKCVSYNRNLRIKQIACFYNTNVSTSIYDPEGSEICWALQSLLSSFSKNEITVLERIFFIKLFIVLVCYPGIHVQNPWHLGIHVKTFLLHSVLHS